VVVELFTNRSERVAPGALLYRGATPLEVLRARPLPPGRPGRPARWVVAFAGLSERNDAEALRDAALSAPPLPDDGTLWVHEMVGATVVDPAGRELGRVEVVEANPASDLLVLEDGGLIPLRFVVHHAPGRLTVELPPGLLELD
jgi:16S rRNA processing protein RimM